MRAPVQDQPDHQVRVQRLQPPQHQPMLLYPFSCECVPKRSRKKQSLLSFFVLLCQMVSSLLMWWPVDYLVQFVRTPYRISSPSNTPWYVHCQWPNNKYNHDCPLNVSVLALPTVKYPNGCEKGKEVYMNSVDCSIIVIQLDCWTVNQFYLFNVWWKIAADKTPSIFELCLWGYFLCFNRFSLEFLFEFL